MNGFDGDKSTGGCGSRGLKAYAAVTTVATIGLAIAIAIQSTTDSSCASPAAAVRDDANTAAQVKDDWCHVFEPTAYNNSGAWVPTIDMRKNFPAWDMEHGYWVGDLTYLGADKSPNANPRWPYKYDYYKGFFRVCLRGSEFVQRNIFVYPPQDQAFCEAHGYAAPGSGSSDGKSGSGGGAPAPGGGECGTHGNEKLWEAGPLFAHDCHGGMQGPYKTPYGEYITNVSIVGPNVVLYNVWYPTRGETVIDDQTVLFQNQMTSFQDKGASRFRTAQGLFPTKSLSYYTENKVSREEMFSQLAAARKEYNVRDEDKCKFDGYGAPTGLDAAGCNDWFDAFFEGCD